MLLFGDEWKVRHWIVSSSFRFYSIRAASEALLAHPLCLSPITLFRRVTNAVSNRDVRRVHVRISHHGMKKPSQQNTQLSPVTLRSFAMRRPIGRRTP